jgi:hypothetical protein
MRYLCLVHVEPAVFTGLSPEAAGALDRDSLGYDRQLAEQGHFIAAEALQDAASGVLVKVRSGKLAVTDGPFAETREQLAGFILIEARDMNEAIRVAGGIPLARYGTVEVRPIYAIPEPAAP